MALPPSSSGGRPIAPQVWAKPDPVVARPSSGGDLRSMLGRGRSGTDAGRTAPGNWMGPLYQVAVQHLSEPVGAVFDPTPAQREALGESLQEHLGAWRDVRLRRSLAQQALFDKVRQNISLFAKPGVVATPKAVSGPVAPKGVPDAPNWGLMEEGHLDEHLAVEREVDRARRLAGSSLHGLTARLAWLRQAPVMGLRDNPLDPSFLIEAMLSAMPADWPVAVRTALWRRLGEWFVPALPALYHAWDVVLFEQGLAPEWTGVSTSGSAPVPAAPVSTLPAQPPSAAPSVLAQARMVPALVQGPQAEAWHHLQTLWATARQREEQEARPAASMLSDVALPEWLVNLEAAAPYVRADEDALLGSLEWASQQNRHMLQAGRLKEVLRGRLREMDASADETARVDFGDHEAAIDTVSAIFEFVLADVQIPESVRLLLARLQLPFVRVAIVEPAMFAQPHHPARRLLNTLAQAGLGWEHTGDRAQAFQAMVRDIIDTVVRDSAAQPGVFATQADAAEQMLNELRLRSERSERRLVEALDGGERLEQAKRQVAGLFQDILDRGHLLPEWLVRLMQNLWAHQTVLVLLRQGETSPAFLASVDLVRQLVAAAQPRLTPDTRSRILLALPGWVRQLREGLTLVNVLDEDRKRLGDQLTAFIEQHTDPRRPDVMMDPRRQEHTGVWQSWAQPVPSLAMPSMITLGETTLATLAALQPGDWLLCRTDHDEVVRGKVAWITRPRDRVLLVNIWGSKLAELAMPELALQLEQGTAQRFSHHPMFDRALAALTRRLAPEDKEAAGSWLPGHVVA